MVGKVEKTKRQRRATILIVLTLLSLVAVVLGCRHCAMSYARRQLKALEISLESVDVELRVLRPPVLHFTTRLENVNTRWMDLVQSDVCLYVNGVRMRCARVPAEDAKLRILGKDSAQVRVSIVPGPEDLVRSALAGVRDHVHPKGVLRGIARVETAVGNLEFPFEMGPFDLELEKLGVSLDPLP